MRKLEKYENQFCKLSNPNSSEKLNPINMILNDIQPFKLSNKKTYNESNIVLSIDEIKQAISNIPINNAPDDFKQIKGIRYNLIDPPKINKISVNHKKYFPDKIFNLIKNELDKTLITKVKFCNKETSCDLIVIDNESVYNSTKNHNSIIAYFNFNPKKFEETKWGFKKTEKYF